MVSVKEFETQDLENANWVWPYPTLKTDLEYWRSSDQVEMRSIYSKDTFLGVAGVRLMRVGVGELFLFPTQEALKHPISLVKAVIYLIGKAKEQFNLHRFQITIEESYEHGHRWAEFLGFDKEGLLKGYDSMKENHWMYGRVFA